MSDNIVTIIIPVYNNILIERALESVKKYKSSNIEVIVIDGNSTDSTKDIISNYKDIIDLFISENDLGPYDAANKGIKKAKGEWLFWFAADDVLLVNPVEVIKNYSSEETDIICGSIIEEKRGGKARVCYSNQNLKRLNYHCSLRQPATFFKRKLFIKNGLYDIRYKYAADREIFLRFRNAGAEFNIIEDRIVYFSYGGLTTSNKVIETYKEDYQISVKYKVNRIVAAAVFVIRSLEFIFKNGWFKAKTIVGTKLK